jgi:xanthine dehydrogenase molybdopterin-binding subunit B
LIGNRWVKTANGQNFADSIGVAEPPMTLEQSVNGVLAQACVSFIQIEMDF